MPPEELEKIAAVCVKHNLVVLTDEIYSELTYEGGAHHCIAALPGMEGTHPSLHGVSKAFCHDRAGASASFAHRRSSSRP